MQGLVGLDRGGGDELAHVREPGVEVGQRGDAAVEAAEDRAHRELALAERDLRQAGYEPVNPHENGLLESDDWGMLMRADIRLLLTCDEVALLPGWQDSKGARVEHALATGLGMHVEELDWYVEDPDALRSSAQVWTGDLVSLDIGDESMGLSARNAVVDDVRIYRKR